mgnify:CR=1 FL=1
MGEEKPNPTQPQIRHSHLDRPISDGSGKPIA